MCWLPIASFPAMQRVLLRAAAHGIASWPRAPSGKTFQEFIIEDGRMNLDDLRLDTRDTPHESTVACFQSIATSEGWSIGLEELLQMSAVWRPRTAAHEQKLLGHLVAQIVCRYENAICSSLEGGSNDSVEASRHEIDAHRASLKEGSVELLS